MPRELSRHEIRTATVKDAVGFNGSAWIDPFTLDLMRLEVVVREIPPHLPLAFGRIVIDYGRLHVARGEFLLPQSTEQNFVGAGQEALNRTTFSGCHAYQTSSAISFGETPPAMPPQPAKPLPLDVPAGIEIESRLDTPFDSDTLARGDPFQGTITRPVLRKGATLFPKCATIHGRVDGIVRSAQPQPCIGIILRPGWIEFKGRAPPFAADQVSVPYQNPSRLAHDPCPFVPEPGSAILQFQESAFQVKSGQIIVWRTAK